ncbi:MAG: hypothetical protein AB9Q19_12595 [Candidatus Reddybacter sp.]
MNRHEINILARSHPFLTAFSVLAFLAVTVFMLPPLGFAAAVFIGGLCAGLVFFSSLLLGFAFSAEG